MVSLAALGMCQKCGRFPCSCVLAGKARQGVVCTVCRRSMDACLCKSHEAGRRADMDSELIKIAPPNVYDELTITALENEAMTYYYNRDPSAITRLIRRVLTV